MLVKNKFKIWVWFLLYLIRNTRTNFYVLTLVTSSNHILCLIWNTLNSVSANFTCFMLPLNPGSTSCVSTGLRKNWTFSFYYAKNHYPLIDWLTNVDLSNVEKNNNSFASFFLCSDGTVLHFALVESCSLNPTKTRCTW